MEDRTNGGLGPNLSVSRDLPITIAKISNRAIILDGFDMKNVEAESILDPYSILGVF